MPIVPDSAAGGEIRVVVRGLRNNEGRVGCSLFNHAGGFPRNREKEYRGPWTPIHSGSAACEFNRIPAGTYAVTVLHDENSDGKMQPISRLRLNPIVPMKARRGRYLLHGLELRLYCARTLSLRLYSS